MTHAERPWPVEEPERLAEQFEAHRPHLRAVAYRMLGSIGGADDAVQEAWLRLSRADATAIENLRAWLTTVVARVCLNMLRARRSRPEEPLEVHLPDPIVSLGDAVDPEHEALLGESVGLAMLVVLDTLSPAERVAFVLHDVFGVPFEEIAPIVERSPTAARQLASRARRRARGAPIPDSDLQRQREVLNAFLAAARNGDFQALVALLDPDVVLRSDGGTARPGLTRQVRGAEAVATAAATFQRFAESARPILVNGAVGGVAFAPNGQPLAVAGITVRNGKIAAMHALADPDRLRSIDLGALQPDP